MRACPRSASPDAERPTISSASPRTGMFALWVEKMNCRRCFSSRMRGTTPSVMKRLSRSSSGWSTMSGASDSNNRRRSTAVAFWPVERSSSACHAGGSAAGAVLSRIARGGQQLELLRAHQYFWCGLGEPFRLRCGDAKPRVQRRSTCATCVHELGKRKITDLTQTLDGFRQPPSHMVS